MILLSGRRATGAAALRVMFAAAAAAAAARNYSYCAVASATRNSWRRASAKVAVAGGLQRAVCGLLELTEKCRMACSGSQADLPGGHADVRGVSAVACLDSAGWVNGVWINNAVAVTQP